MSLLSNIKTDENVVSETDFLGREFVVDSGLYDMTIDLAYVAKVASGALGLTLHLTDGSCSIVQTIYITSGDAKNNKSTYVSKRDGSIHHIPGYSIGNAVSLLSIGKEINTLTTEEKIVNRRDKAVNKDIPQKTNVITELMGQKITIGIVKQLRNKSKLINGNYEDTSDTFEQNEISKVFRSKDKFTVTEIRAEAKEAVFYDKWDKKFTGTTVDKTTFKSDSNTEGKPVANLFNTNNTSESVESINDTAEKAKVEASKNLFK